MSRFVDVDRRAGVSIVQIGCVDWINGQRLALCGIATPISSKSSEH